MVAFVSSPRFVQHFTGIDHPERPDRIRAIERALEDERFAGLVRERAPMAGDDLLTLAHPEAYVRALREAAPREGLVSLDADTVMSPGTMEAVLRGVGAAAHAVDEVMTGKVANAFSAMRPPGHHAERARPMGFCLFNNAAIAARHAQKAHGAERVAILDWDVHHGNGTAAAFYDRADVLFASIHQMPLYPGTGSLHETGAGAWEGYTINLPVPPGSTEELWLSLLEHVVLPAALAFEPDLLLVSAGFDGHASDPLAGCRLQSSSFAQMTCLLRDAAAERRLPVGVVLEGGYNPQALGECVRDTLAALGGEGEARRGAPWLEQTARAAAALKAHWPLATP